jgi:hypothetical protein
MVVAASKTVLVDYGRLRGCNGSSNAHLDRWEALQHRPQRGRVRQVHSGSRNAALWRRAGLRWPGWRARRIGGVLAKISMRPFGWVLATLDNPKASGQFGMSWYAMMQSGMTNADIKEYIHRIGREHTSPDVPEQWLQRQQAGNKPGLQRHARPENDERPGATNHRARYERPAFTHGDVRRHQNPS